VYGQATHERQRRRRQQEAQEGVAVGSEEAPDRDHRHEGEHDERGGQRDEVGRDHHPTVGDLAPEAAALEPHGALARSEPSEMRAGLR
jgi:hypothetical protein